MSEFELNILKKLHGETALMYWRDLQRFFAQGNVLYIRKELDLVQTAVWFALDDTTELASHIASQSISQPSNEQAQNWFDGDVELWAVVVAPYVLVQEQKS